MSSIRDHIIHSDHHLVIVNKPPAYPLEGSDDPEKPGLLTGLQAYFKRDVFLVNRIDTPVSGVIVLTKNSESAAKLSKQFRQREIKKLYLAVSRKKSTAESGAWQDNLKQLDHINKTVTDQEKGKMAKTQFTLIESLDHVHLYLLRPETGRHHQLRVQMSENLGAIRGDQKYGDKRGNKDRSIDLHSWALQLTHPSSGELMTFVAELPQKPPWVHFDFLKQDPDVGKYFKD
ncbi:MAG: RluA family pseudouridine synthase [Saprospiraceae bacterium]|nr:RluA family pseudouridine synthase [Saprospiraceae bacterium]